MGGIGCYRLEQLPKAKQLLLAHEPQHALMVDRIAAILKFCCDPGRESAIGCYLYNLFIYATWGVAKWAKEVQSLDS